MNKKKFFGLLAVLVLTFMSMVCFASCRKLVENHEHTYSTNWTYDETYHWHKATCEHTDEISGKAEHIFVNGTCSDCGYKENATPHKHTYSSAWTHDEEYHWRKATCEHTTEISGKAKHNFVDNVCSDCGYEKEISHEHTYSSAWTYDNTYHWHKATCEHKTEISGKAKHNFVDNVCSDCGYEKEISHEHTYSSAWTYDNTYHWHKATCEHKTEISGKAKHNFGEWQTVQDANCTTAGLKKRVCTDCAFEETENIQAVGHNHVNGICKNCGDAITYYATFVAQENEVKRIAFTMKDEAIDAPAVPNKSGYNGAWETYSLKASDFTVTAVYTPITYTITYQNAEGLTNSNPTSYTIKSSDIVLSDIEKEGYIFKGWFTAEDFDQNSKVTKITSNMLQDVVLYAKFLSKTPTYYVEYYQENINDENYSLFETVTLTAQAGATVTAPAKTYVGFTYNSDAENILAGTVDAEQPLTLKRYYTRNTFAVSFTSNDGTFVSGTKLQIIKYQAQAVAPVYEKAGYTYTWDKPLTITENTSFTAIWSPNENSIIFDGNGATSGEMENQIVHTDEKALLSVNAYVKNGYTFMGWATSQNGEAVFENGAEYTMGANSSYTLYAVWSANTNTLLFNGNHADSGEMQSYTLKTDEKITLPENSFVRAHYIFMGWSNEQEGSITHQNGAEYVMGSESIVTLYAVWSPVKYNIMYHLDGGTNSKNNPAYYTVEDSAVVLSDASKTGYTFVGWYSESEFSNPVTQIESQTCAEVSVYAKYTINQYTVMFESNGGTEYASITQDYNSALTLPKPEKDGFIFKGWYFDGKFENECAVTKMPAYDSTLYAKWARTVAMSFELIDEGASYTVAGLSSDADVSTAFELKIPAEYEGKPITAIGDQAFFGQENLNWISIGENIKTIGEMAFGNCTSLTGIVIPENVTNIGAYVFYGCSNLESITIPFVGANSGATEASATTLFGYIFGNTNYNGAVVTEQFYGGNSSCMYNIPASLKSVTVTGGVLFYGAFYNCSNLTSVTIGNSVTSIGGRTFYNCSNLTSVTIGNSVTSIGGRTFYNCSNLTSITISNSVTSIGSSALYGCSSLKEITLPFVGNSIKSSSDTYQYPFGYIFGEGSYTGGVATEQYYYGSSTSERTSSTYYIPALLTSVTITGGNILYGAFYNCSKLTSVKIPDGVTSIGDWAFYNCSNLTSVTIGNSVTSIGHIAFRNCSSLTSVTIPDSVTSIGQSVFSGCSSLEKITLPFVGNSIKSSSDTYRYPFGYIFGEGSYTGGVATKQYYYGSSTSERTSSTYYIPALLTSVTITGGNILYGAFYNCSKLTSVKIPDGVTSIGGSAFLGCSSLTSVTIPDSVTSIGYEAFRGCSSLTSVTIPDSVTRIEYSAFSGCGSLSSIIVSNGNTKYHSSGNCLIESSSKILITGCKNSVIPTDGSVTSIGDWAFRNCSNLTSITIPDSVTSIGRSVFSGCSSLEEITLPFVGNSIKSSSDTYQYPFGYIFGESSYTGGVATKQYYYGSSTSSINSTTYYIPSSLKSVTITGGELLRYAFYECSSLTSVTIGNGVTSIGDYAFWHCSSLTSVTIPDSVTSIGQYAFYECKSLTSVTIPDSVTSIVSNAFSGCSSLTSVTIPDSVTEIEWCAFEGCSLLTSVTIPDRVKSVGSGAFYNCSSLTSVTIPDSVMSIGDDAFKDCSSLTIYCEAKYNSSWSSNWNSSNCPVVMNCKSNDRDKDGYAYAIIGGVRYSLKDNFATVIRQPVDISTASIPSLVTYKDVDYSVTSIVSNAFSGCSSLTSVVIPDSVTGIGRSTFYNCSKLTSVTIGNGVTSIGDYAFSGCSSLTSVVIPDGVTSIGWNAFSGCSSLTSVTIPDSVTSIGSNAFSGCSSLTSVTIPDSVTSIGHSVFSGCSSLTSVTIPDSVKSIGSNAFSGCSSLTSIVIPNSVKSIGSNAFSGCSSLTSVTFKNTSGWIVSTSSMSSVTSLSASDLFNTSTAATYLKSTYVNYYWERG